jgi:hypothetical protein
MASASEPGQRLPASEVNASTLDEDSLGVEGDFRRLAASVERMRYRGWEFDDFLASAAVRRLTLGNHLAKRVAIQIGERLPVNLRPLLGVPQLQSTKADGFFARGYLHAHRATGDDAWLTRGRALLDGLLLSATPGYSGLAWGNAFDFASRGGFLPAGLPTVVWTAHISEAFRLGHDVTGDRRYADAVVSVAHFVLRDLERHEDPDGVCIAYAPEVPALVHNSNLLGAVALLRGWSLSGEADLLQVARRAFAWTLTHQEEDGSWRYGVGPKYEWIDNFHTAYVLDCLRVGRELLGEELVPSAVIDSTYSYWRDSFFLADGTPRYYHDRTYPLDIQCAAQAISTFARRSDVDSEALRRAQFVLRRTNELLRRSDGLYEYRRGRFLRNGLVSIHWGQSTMLEALGVLLERMRGASGA